MKFVERAIELEDGETISSVWAVPRAYEPGRGDAVIIAHGAGNDMDSPFISFIHEGLALHGCLSVKFNFLYKERGRRAPDRAPVLEAAWRATVRAVRGDRSLAPARLFLAGKSMGGRIASHLAAAGEPCDGLVFLGYPLHPANNPERLRAEHLRRIRCPLLFVQGTRDSLCRLDLLEHALAEIAAPVTLHLIEGGDHSFKVLKRLGRGEEEVLQEVADVMAAWIAGMTAG